MNFGSNPRKENYGTYVFRLTVILVPSYWDFARLLEWSCQNGQNLNSILTGTQHGLSERHCCQDKWCPIKTSKESSWLVHGFQFYHAIVHSIGHFPLGLFRTNVNKQWQMNIQINKIRLRISTGERKISWLFTTVAKKLILGLQRTTSAGIQNKTWIQELRISNPVLQPLSHAASSHLCQMASSVSLREQEPNPVLCLVTWVGNMVLSWPLSHANSVLFPYNIAFLLMKLV